MKLVVDTNVWLDLNNAGVLSRVTASTFRWLVPDLLQDELQALELPSCVEIRESDATELNAIVEVRRSRQALSNADAILFVATVAEEATLVTGDRALRVHAREAGVNVHGVIWLLGECIENEVLSRKEAADALSEMVSAGARLPPDIVADRLRRWRS